MTRTVRHTEEIEVPALPPLKYQKIANAKTFPMEDLLNVAVFKRQMKRLQNSLEIKAIAFCNKNKNETALPRELGPRPRFLAFAQSPTARKGSERVIQCGIKEPFLRQCGEIAVPSREVECELINDFNNIDSIHIVMEGYHYSISPELVTKMKAFIQKGNPLRIIGERVDCETAFLLVDKSGILALPVTAETPGVLASRCSCRDSFATRRQLNELKKSCKYEKKLHQRLKDQKKLVTDFCQPVDPTWNPSFWSSPRTGKWTAFYEPALYSNRLYGFNKLVHKQKFDVAALKAKAVNMVRCDKTFAHTAEVCGRTFRSIKCPRFSDIDFESSTPIFKLNKRNFQALKPFPPVAPDKAAQTDVIAYFDGDVPHFWAITDDSLKRIKTVELTLETHLNDTSYSMASLESQKPLSAEANSPLFAVNSFLTVAERNREIRETFKVLLDKAKDYCHKIGKGIKPIRIRKGFSVPLQKFEDVLKLTQKKLAFVQCAIPNVSPQACYGVIRPSLNFRCGSLAEPASYDQAIVKIDHQVYLLPNSTMAATRKFLGKDEDLQIVGDLRGCQASFRAVGKHRIQELEAVELILHPHQYNCRCSNPTAAERDLKAHEQRCKDIYAFQTRKQQDQALGVVRAQKKFVRSYCRPAELVADVKIWQGPGYTPPSLSDLAMDEDRLVEDPNCRYTPIHTVENLDTPLRVEVCSSTPGEVRIVCDRLYSFFQCGKVSRLVNDNTFEWNRNLFTVTEIPTDMSQEEIAHSDIVLYENACGPRFFATGKNFLRPLRAVQLDLKMKSDVQIVRRVGGDSSSTRAIAAETGNGGSSNLASDRTENNSLQKRALSDGGAKYWTNSRGKRAVKIDELPLDSHSKMGRKLGSSGTCRPRRQLAVDSLAGERPSKFKAKVLQERQPYIETQANLFQINARIIDSTPMVNQIRNGGNAVSAFEGAQSSSLAPESLANPIFIFLIVGFCLVRKAYG